MAIITITKFAATIAYLATAAKSGATAFMADDNDNRTIHVTQLLYRCDACRSRTL